MAIPKLFINSKITLIERAIESSVGGDFTTTTIVEREICAIREPFNAFASAGDRVERDLDSEIILADNTFFIGLEDAQGDLRAARAGDLITWESLRLDQGGPSDSRAEIVRINIWEAPGLKRQHVEIFVRGQGAP